jgi:rhodanese-related sulfurtransferase
MKLKKGFKQMVDEAKARITTLPLDEARKRLGKEGVVFVDLRDVRELEREGQIPGAFHCPRGMLEFWLDPESPYHKPVFAEGKEFVFFCNGAWRSALAADTAQQMGLENVSEMDGGFTGWKSAGHPVEARERKKA